MKVINGIIGIFIILLGSLLMSITVDNETLETIGYKICGLLTLAGGVIYLKKVAKFGRQ